MGKKKARNGREGDGERRGIYSGGVGYSVCVGYQGRRIKLDDAMMMCEGEDDRYTHLEK